MNTKALLVISLAVNAFLLGAEIYLVKQDPGDLTTLAPVVVCTAHTRPEAAAKPAASTAPATNQTQAVQ
jgi:hypothetical protein